MQTCEYVNLISRGIIDPTKVVRVAIQNAASVAVLLITTEAMVAEVPKKNQGGGGCLRVVAVWAACEVWTASGSEHDNKKGPAATAGPFASNDPSSFRRLDSTQSDSGMMTV